MRWVSCAVVTLWYSATSGSYSGELNSLPLANLAPSLQPIVDLELVAGNRVARVDEGMWSETPLVVVFEQRLHHDKIKQLNLPATVKFWENRDTHYALESGYSCQTSHHAVSGPL
jgi:hypothetical protein